MGLCSTVRAYASRGVDQTVQSLGGLHLGTLNSRTIFPCSVLAARASFVPRQAQCPSAASNRSTSRSRDVLRKAAAQANLEQVDQCSRHPAAAAAGSHLCEAGSSHTVGLSSHDSLYTPKNAARFSSGAGSSTCRVQSQGSQCLSDRAGEAAPAGTAATDSITTASRRRRLPRSQRAAYTHLHSVIEPLASVPQDTTFSCSSGGSSSTGSGSSSSGSGSSSSATAPQICDSITTTHHDTLCSVLPRPTLENLSFHDSAFTPRDFQVEAIQCIVQEWKAGSSVQMVMLPTGTGKTVVILHLARFIAPYVSMLLQDYSELVPVATLDDAHSVESGIGSSNSQHAQCDVAAEGEGVKDLASGTASGHCSTTDSAADQSHDASSSSHPDASAQAAALRQLLAGAASASDSAGGTCIQPDGCYSGGTSRGSDSSGSQRSSTGQDQAHAVPVRQGAEHMRVLLLAHRGELLQQAQEKLQLVWPEATVSWVKGTRKEFWGQVVLASVQTAKNCLEQLLACRFRLVVVDEAHHSVADSYLQVLKGLGFVKAVAADPGKLDDHSRNSPAVDSWDEDVTSGSSSSSSILSSTSPGTAATRIKAVYSPHALLVGFTATPYRLRKEESEQLYEIFHLTYTMNTKDAIQRKHLSQIHSRKIFTDTDLKGARAVNGDFTPATLSPIVNSSSRNKLVLHAYLDYCTEPAASSAGSDESGSQPEHVSSHSGSSTSSTDVDRTSNENAADSTGAHLQASTMAGRHATRKAIGFAVDICHAETLHATFLDAGIRSAVIHSKRPDEENSRMLWDLKHDQLDIVWNVEKLTEGFDEPSLDAVLMVRPTRSTVLYTQMLGRGLRCWPAKQNCLVLDFSDKYHRVDRTVDLRFLLGDAGPYTNLNLPPPALADRVAKVDSQGLQGGVMSVLEDDINPLDLAWRQFGPHYMCNLFDNGNVWLVTLAEMGSNQRQMLGLRLQGYPQDNAAAVAVATEGMARRTAEHSSSDKQLSNRHAKLEGLEDRYVVLHQPSSRNHSPMTWSNAAPLAVQGMTTSDAHGAAVHYMDVLIRQNQQRALGNWRKKKFFKAPAQLTTFSKNAPWRRHAMGSRQIALLEKLKVSYNPKWTKGDASDAINAALCKQATGKQRAQLQEKLGEDEYNNLPVPLLAKHAVTLGASDDA